MTPAEKRRRFLDLAQQPHVQTGREFEQHRGQLDLDFTPARGKHSYCRARIDSQRTHKST